MISAPVAKFVNNAGNISPGKMQNIEIFEHTADVGIRLSRPTREALFRDAALGMCHIIAPGNVFRTPVDYTVEVTGADDEELMVNWLSELNFYLQTKQYVPVEMTLKMSDTQLAARISGDVLDRNLHNVEIEIKAVTFHKIIVEQKNGQWRAQIIFDI